VCRFERTHERGLKEHNTSTVRFAIFALFASAALLTGIAKTATGKACKEYKTRPVASLEREEGRRVFREGLRFFKLCPIALNYVQHIFPGAKIFSASPLVTGLYKTLGQWGIVCF